MLHAPPAHPHTLTRTPLHAQEGGLSPFVPQYGPKRGHHDDSHARTSEEPKPALNTLHLCISPQSRKGAPDLESIRLLPEPFLPRLTHDLQSNHTNDRV